MKPDEKIHETLAFVQEALQKKENEDLRSWPWGAIYWGAFFLISFAMIDWDRALGLRVFNYGALAGAFLSAGLAIATDIQRRRRGETTPHHEAIVGKIVLGILASFAALIVMGMSGRFEFIPYFQILMLLIGLELYVFGILHRFTPLSVCGLLLLVWAVALAWVNAFQLTVGGCIIAAGMLAVAIAHRKAVTSSR
ncbi:MAG: hypothetical protein AAGJ79_07705 [Verrucomicrobiota bacterium]